MSTHLFIPFDEPLDIQKAIDEKNAHTIPEAHGNPVHMKIYTPDFGAFDMQISNEGVPTITGPSGWDAVVSEGKITGLKERKELKKVPA